MSALPKSTSEQCFDAQDVSGFVTNQAEMFLSWLRVQPGIGTFVATQGNGVLTLTFTNGLRLTLMATLPDDLTHDRTRGEYTGC